MISKLNYIFKFININKYVIYDKKNCKKKM